LPGIGGLDGSAIGVAENEDDLGSIFEVFKGFSKRATTRSLEVKMSPARQHSRLVFTTSLLTYDGSKMAAGVAIYFDGVAVATSVVVDTLTSSTASGLPVRFGMRNDSSDPLFGPMAFVRIYGTNSRRHKSLLSLH
jgi:hypothetical protein